MLKPECVELKGHRTADRDERREATFVRSLKLRMGYDPPSSVQPILFLTLHTEMTSQQRNLQLPQSPDPRWPRLMRHLHVI